MQFQIVKPSVMLARYIRHYWVLDADKSDGIVTERVVPTGAIELMFHYRNPFKCLTSDKNEVKQSQSFISGISSTYADVSTQGESGMIAVTFLPHGACHFFPFPMSETENMDISLDCLIGREAEMLEQKLYFAGSLEERIKIIEDFLIKQFSEIRIDDVKLVINAVFLINQHKGRIQSMNLSEKLYVTPKSLERKFTSLVGKSPKQYSRIVRFQSVIDSISKGNTNNYTQIALENGYYDQAHFIKDFKMFSGLTPHEFFCHYQCPSDYYS